MTETPEHIVNRPAVGNLTDFVVYDGKSKHLDLQVAVMNTGVVVVFHSHPFKNEVSWFEFDLGTNKLDFVMNDGEFRDVGLPLTQDVSKHMQNAHQILMVLMDPVTGEAKEGNYVPVVIHRKI